MEDVKGRLAAAIAARLTAAPDGPAKSELIEELSDNLYARYQDLTAAGTEEEAAYRAALEDLGDTAELVDYLNSLEPGEPLPGPEEPEGEAFDGVDGLFDNLEKIIGRAVQTAKDAARQAKDAAKDVRDSVKRNGYYAYTSPDGRWQVNVNRDTPVVIRKSETSPKSPTSPESPTPSAPPTSPAPPAQQKEPDGTPRDPGESIRENPDGQYAGALHSIDVEVQGDITLRMTRAPEDEVVIGGNVDELAVSAEDGVLTIRQQSRTAPAGFLFRRGLSCADVELTLPRRPWASIRLKTGGGDTKVIGDGPVEELSVAVGSGDVTAALPRCGRLEIQGTDGDLAWEGCADAAALSTVNGNVRAAGNFGDLSVSSTNGDVAVSRCRVERISGATVNGNLKVTMNAMPQGMELSAVSGDISASLPDEGPFAVEAQTMSGDFTSSFFTGHMSGRRCAFSWRGGTEAGGPVYRLSSVNGDITLRRR